MPSIRAKARMEVEKGPSLVDWATDGIGNRE